MSNDNKPKVDLNDLHFHLPVGRLDQPNRNGTVYSREALEKAVSGEEILAAAARAPIGKAPSFNEFLKMIAPQLSDDDLEKLAVAFDRINEGKSYSFTRGLTTEQILERRDELQRLYDRAKEMGGRMTLTLRAGDGKPPQTEADCTVIVNPHISGDHPFTAKLVKCREPHPDADRFSVVFFDDRYPSDRAKSLVTDRDVENMYLTPTLPLSRDSSPVRSVSFEPSFGSDLLEQSAGCRRLMGLVSHRQRHVSGDITVNGKQRKELVSNAQGTMVFPRAKQKFGRR
jgi:hypothetical protein